MVFVPNLRRRIHLHFDFQCSRSELHCIRLILWQETVLFVSFCSLQSWPQDFSPHPGNSPTHWFSPRTRTVGESRLTLLQCVNCRSFLPSPTHRYTDKNKMRYPSLFYIFTSLPRSRVPFIPRPCHPERCIWIGMPKVASGSKLERPAREKRNKTHETALKVWTEHLSGGLGLRKTMLGKEQVGGPPVEAKRIETTMMMAAAWESRECRSKGKPM